ncbi:MAG: hypothetical protein MUC83_07965, partial [Pirellula sp.]|nr:hypothetical protein [Pirellula sp.]
GLDRESLLHSISAIEQNTTRTHRSKLVGVSKTLGSSTYEMLKAGSGYEKLFPHLTTQRFKNGTLTKGEQIVWGAMGAAFAATVRYAGPEEVFVRCADAWPKTVLDSLKIVGAKKSAALLKKTFSMLFPKAAPTLTGNALARTANRVSKNDPAVRKAWALSWKSTNENVDALTRKFLLANPQLF